MKRDPRYQFQPRIVKVYRWLRYKPKWAIISIKCIISWILTGMPLYPEFSSRWELLKCIWGANFGPADFEMQHWYTQKEMNGQYKETP